MYIIILLQMDTMNSVEQHDIANNGGASIDGDFKSVLAIAIHTAY